MRHLFFISFMLLSAFHLNANQAVQLLQQTIETYANAKNLGMDIMVHEYDSPLDITGKILGKASVRKQDENYYSSFLGDEMIINKKCCLLIDHADKSITYSDKDNLREKNKMPVLLDSIITPNDSIVLKEIKDGLRHFIIYTKSSYINQTEVYVDDHTHLIKRIIYYYHELSSDESIGAYKIELDYVLTSFSAPAKNCFDESKYIVFKQGKPILQNSYSSYTLTISEPK